MSNYSALIVDDEKGNREYLAGLLEKHCPAITEVRMASSATAALALLESAVPDVVFLDIEMPGGSGFDFLNQAGSVDFRIIFVTAYDAYALRAIKYSALDYLLKPVDPDELVKAVEKLDENKPEKKRLDLLAHNLKNKEDRRIALSTQDEVIFVRIEEIIRLQGEANYTRIYLENDPPVLLSGNLGHFERLLQDDRFYRSHQSHLINSGHIRKYVKTEGGYFLMSDESQVPVARMKKDEVKRLFM